MKDGLMLDMLSVLFCRTLKPFSIFFPNVDVVFFNMIIDETIPFICQGKYWILQLHAYDTITLIATYLWLLVCDLFVGYFWWCWWWWWSPNYLLCVFVELNWATTNFILTYLVLTYTKWYISLKDIFLYMYWLFWC